MLELADALEHFGLHCTGKTLEASELTEEVCPLIAHLSSPDHFVIILGVTDDIVHFLDVHDQRGDVTKAKISKRWSAHVLMADRMGKNEPLTDHPSIVFDTLHRDLGRLPSTIDNVRCEFNLRNAGKKPLVIHKTITSCSCIEVDSPMLPIPPGEDARIALTFRQDATKGGFAHQVLINSNDPDHPEMTLMVTGSVEGPFVDVGCRTIDVGSLGQDEHVDVVVPLRFDRHVDFIEVVDMFWSPPIAISPTSLGVARELPHSEWWPQTKKVGCQDCEPYDGHRAFARIRLTINDELSAVFSSVLNFVVRADEKVEKITVRIKGRFWERVNL